MQVNSPDKGKVVQLFAEVGDTVTVGGDLFKIELGVDSPSVSKPVSTPPSPSPSSKQIEKKLTQPKPVTPPTTPVSTPISPPPTPPAPSPKMKAAPPPQVNAVSPALAAVNFESDEFPGYTLGVRTERAVHTQIEIRSK